MTNFDIVIRSLLSFADDRDRALLRVLDEVLMRFSAETGTIHRLDPGRGMLVMLASRHLPPPVLEVTREIPLGKGIAGEAAKTGKPVTTCNLQTDDSGVARPGAKQTGVGGALCVPMFRGEAVVGALGIGTRLERDWSEEEVYTLTQIGKVLARELDLQPAADGAPSSTS